MTMTKAELEARVRTLELLNDALESDWSASVEAALEAKIKADERAEALKHLVRESGVIEERLSGWQECAREFMDRPTTVNNTARGSTGKGSGCIEVAK